MKLKSKTNSILLTASGVIRTDRKQARFTTRQHLRRLQKLPMAEKQKPRRQSALQLVLSKLGGR